MRPITLLTSAVLLIAIAPPAAFAHAQLASADPAPGATVSTPPGNVQITFDDEVEPRFTTITVTDPHGRRVHTGKLEADPHDAKRVSVTVPQLAPGRYKVEWHATDTDTHKTNGTYTFTVAH